MPGQRRTERATLAILSDGEPRPRVELIDETGLTGKAIGSGIFVKR